MGWLDDIGDAVGGAVDVVVDVVETAVDTVVDTAMDVGGAVAGAVAPVLDFGSSFFSPVFGLGETIVNTVTDPVGALQDLGNIITDPIGAVEGAFGSVMDYGSGLVEGVGGVVMGVGGAAYDLAGDALDTSLGLLGQAGGIAGEVIGAAGGLVNAATGGYAEDALNFIDDNVLDNVDYLTGGLINVDYDNGGLSASVGVDNLLSVGGSIGADGITASADAPLLGVDVGLTGDHGATVLLDENIPGVDIPYDAQLGVGVSADGGAGVIAMVEVAGRDIAVGIAGDYDDDISLDQAQALGGGSSARMATPTPEGAPVTQEMANGNVGRAALGVETMAGMATPTPEPIADVIDSFDADLSLDSSAFAVDAPTDFAQDIVQVDQIESAADDVWGDLG